MSTDSTLFGPPYLTGELHVGNCCPIFSKDFILNYNRIFNKRSENYTYNFDAQGLPLEQKIRTLYPKASAKETVKECLKLANRNLTNIQNQLKSMNLRPDISTDNILCTTNLSYKVSQMNYFKRLFDRNILYESLKHLPFCYNCDTVLANAQIESQVIDRNAYVIGAEILEGKFRNALLLFATTQPHTLINNCAIALKPEKEYYVYTYNNKIIIAGTPKLDQLLQIDAQLIDVVQSKLLSNTRYKLCLKSRILSKGKIILSDIVTDLSSESTDRSLKETVLDSIAAVHLSVLDSKTDYDVIFTQPDTNKFKSWTNENVIKRQLKIKKNIYFKREMWLEELRDFFKLYSFREQKSVCWRCKLPLDYFLTRQWFLRISPQDRSQMLKLIEGISLNEESMRSKLINWFEKPVDWCVSRSRYYGTPFPLAYCTNTKCDLNLKRLSIEFNSKDFRDESQCYPHNMKLILKRKNITCNSCHKDLTPELSVLDVWCDSGFLALHFNKSYDWLIEGQDQIRGFFYCLAVMYFLQKKQLPYNGLIFTGWFVNNTKDKLSKSKGAQSITEVIEQSSLEALKSYCISKCRSKDVLFSIDKVQEEKKYTNNILNVIRYLKFPEYQVSLKDINSVVRDLIASDSSLKPYIRSFLKLRTKIHNFVKRGRIDLYWIHLKNYILHVYSRKLINTYKKLARNDLNLRILIKYIGTSLLKLANPAIGNEYII
jgi:isoleucyl-tRNA synthetase